MPEISIIIILSNNKKYLRQTILSAEAQTFKNTELIQSDNLNKALSKAKGKYIIFIQSGAQLTSNALEKLYTAASAKDYDIVTSETQAANTPAYDLTKPEYSSLDFLKAYAQMDLPGLKLIKRSLFTDNNISYTSDAQEDDTALTYALFIFAGKVKHIKDKLLSYPQKAAEPKAKDSEKPLKLFKSFAAVRQILLAKKTPFEVMEEFEYNLLAKILGGENNDNDKLHSLDKKHFQQFARHAARFYLHLPENLFKNRNLIFRLKFFFLKMSLKYNNHWISKAAKPFIQILAFFYYPIVTLLGWI